MRKSTEKTWTVFPNNYIFKLFCNLKSGTYKVLNFEEIKSVGELGKEKSK